MSQASLQELVRRLETVTTKDFRRTVGDKLTTAIYLSESLIADEIVSEIQFSRSTKKGSVPKVVLDAVPELARECFKLISNRARSSTVVTVEPYGLDGIVISSSGDRNNFKAIYDVTKVGTDQLRRRLNTLLEKARQEKLGSNVFDIGHFDGSNTDVQIGKYISETNSEALINKVLANSSLTEIKHAMSIASQFNAAQDKEFVVQCILEAKGPNRAKQEAALRKQFLDTVKTYVASNDWANQEGSDSKMQAIMKSLNNAAVKAGSTGTLQQLKLSASKAALKGSTRIPVKITAVKFDAKLSDIKVDAVRSYVSLIPILNAKLPPAVRANMTGGRLHNRSGRFSESVRITSIEQTPQGYPRVNYTYQRSPYDVFDPALGRAPWNKPGRDPKTLIERSVRDIAKGLITERFYVRRSG